MVNETVEKSARTLLEELWSHSQAILPGSGFFRHALEATSCLGGKSPQEYHRSVLGELIRIFGAERAFLFPCENPAEEDSVELGNCSASRDLDGDSINDPASKVSETFLLKAARGGLPCYEETDNRCGSRLALPAVSRDSVRGVILVENRFKELNLEERNLAAALVYCRAMAAGQDLAKASEENESLWRELCRQKESGEKTPAPPTKARTKTRRKGLVGDYSAIIGGSPRMLEILQVIDRLSKSCAPVLVNGESGTGKELAALAIHQNSPRRDRKFVSENCGALTETLLESELFGYVKGAFTGATKDHKGLFEQAVGGTFFLDEVGDMSPSMQKKILRVLQEGVIRRVGSKEFTPVDIRIVSATNKDLLQECKAGNFREDLYYRLNVINLVLPPLRDRREDIPDLVEYFLGSPTTGSPKPVAIEDAALELMTEYSWPGNIRELQNEILKLAALCDDNLIRAKDLSEHLIDGVNPMSSTGKKWTEGFAHMSLKQATDEFECELIRQALAKNSGNKSLVAKSLRIPKTTLYNKIKKYKL